MTLATSILPAVMRDALAELLLSLADDEFVLGFWDSEWTGIAPMLEEDVAMSSISQDEIGHARALYELLGELTGRDPDEIAFGRGADDYRHAALLNHARTDWAFTIARRYLYETADAVRLEALTGSSYEPLAQVTAKMRREETYHLLHLDTWLRRLADSDAHERLAEAIGHVWADAQAVFAPLDAEAELLRGGVLPEPLAALRERWLRSVLPTLSELGLLPDATPEPDASGRTRRTDEFRWLHAEFTSVVGSEEGAAW